MKTEHKLTGAFVVLFVSIIIIIVVCVSTKNGWKQPEVGGPAFWRTGVVYQVYPRSFRDTDGDGIGDLPGIIERLEHLQKLGVDIVWLNSIYESPMKNFGLDVSNYTAVDPIFGTLEDFDRLVTELHRRGLKLVMDFVPNHSSDQHEWFRKSEAREGEYADYYVWANAKDTKDLKSLIPPNDWTNVRGESAWTWSEKRGQFYYHQFLKEQPDLNYYSDGVKEEMKKVLRFWLQRGVDGFCVDAMKYLVEDTIQEQNGSFNHNLTFNHPETFQVLREWREVLDEFHDRVLMVDVDSDIEDVMKYYGNKTFPLAHIPFNSFLMESLTNRSLLTGYALKDTVSLWLNHMPEDSWSNWMLGNHNNGRVASRVGQDIVDALNMLLLLLPGTPITYYGEEIGMEDTFVSWEDTKDPEGCYWGMENYQEHSRDPERTPMQWNDANMTGFTSGNSTWLPINMNYKEINVAAQMDAPQSSFKLYQRLTELRQEKTFQYGYLSFPTYDTHIFSFVRSLEEHPTYLVVINLDERDRIVNLLHGANFPLPHKATLVLSSSTDLTEETRSEPELPLEALPLLGGEGLVLKLSYA